MKRKYADKNRQCLKNWKVSRMDRELDGVYFRIERDGKWQPICFSDLTEQEREKVCEGRSTEWLKSLAYHLADCIKEIGEQFDIAGGEQK